MLAHELRNPLTPIRNVAHILTDQRADIDTLRRCGLLVQRQVANVARLVDDLLDVARVRRGLIEIKNAPLDLHTVIDSAIETLQSSFDEKQQIVSFTRLPIRALVNGDSVRLEQVFTNLLANASKFSPPYSRIDLQAAVGDEGFLVRIRDHGDGIDAQLLPRIFDLFVQGDQSLDRPQAGLGIGLTLVKWVVELHKGSVRVASQGLGHGAEFIVALPIATDAEPAVPEPVAAATATVRRRVLIVEDNSDSAESLRILLRLAGHEVVATNQAFGALEALESFAPEFIFADVGLPGLDGFSLAGMIRHHPRGKDARVYAVTGYGRPQDREQALAAGFDGQLTKPVDPKVLLALLNEELVHRGATPIEQQ
jgi:CheY-like chemotaxis protein